MAIQDDNLDDWIGRTLEGRFRVLERIGSGSMGAVFLAENTGTRRKLVIKVLLPEFALNKQLKERFKREALAIARLDHPNVVELYGTGEEEGIMYMVMEYIDGSPLSDILHTVTRLRQDRALTILKQIIDAIEHAHDLGLVHRDLKPSNIMLTRTPEGDDHIKILDFGLAKLSEQSADAPKITKPGAVFGTPAYMAPEQVRGEEIDHRADIYAFGAVAYQILSGHTPHTAENRFNLMMKTITEPAPALSQACPEAAIEPALEAIVMQCLQIQPRDRIQTSAEVRSALHRVGESAGSGHPGGSGPRPGTAVTGEMKVPPPDPWENDAENRASWFRRLLRKLFG